MPTRTLAITKSIKASSQALSPTKKSIRLEIGERVLTRIVSISLFLTLVIDQILFCQVSICWPVLRVLWKVLVDILHMSHVHH